MKKLKSYMIKFEVNSGIKVKIYPFDYIVERLNQCLIMVITHN